MDSRIRRNLYVVLALLPLFFGVAVMEGYLRHLVSGFGLVLLAGFLATTVLAVLERTGRILSLMAVVFAVELLKEPLGIRSGLWLYTGRLSTFLTGAFAWVLASLSIFTLAKYAVSPFLRAWLPTKSTKAHGPILLGVLGLALILVKLQAPPMGVGLWLLYAALFGVAAWNLRKLDLPMLIATLLCAWGVGSLSETLGSRAGVWVFPGLPSFPPAYLLLGLWPIDVLGQFALARMLVRDETPFDRKADLGLSLGWSAPWVAEEEKITPLLPRERWAQWFFRGSALVYLVVGMMFIVIPDSILRWANGLSAFLVGDYLPPIPVGGGHFWTSLAFSMMMTITAICVAGQYNIRKNRNLLILLLVSKAASSISGFALFFGQAHYFAYLAIGLVDGSLCVASFFFFLLGSSSFLKIQTWYTRQPANSAAPTTDAARVVILKDQGLGQALLARKSESRLRKFTLLETILEQSGFWTVIERKRVEAQLGPMQFRVAIKPNFMFSHAREDLTTYTDPELVMHLVDLLRDRGYTQVAIVEAQSTYGNYYENRGVEDVAKVLGYDTKNYQVVDLTREKVPHYYGGRLQWHVVGPTWRDAHFRVSFAKNKTHMFCNYTLTIKNIYGTLPEQNKLKEYHTKREYDWPTIESIQAFPVHFGIIDAILSADGQFGVLASASPRATDCLIAGENIIAVDTVGARKMGLNPDGKGCGRFLPLAIETFGRPGSIEVVGDQSVYSPWINVSELLVKPLDLLEESYTLSNWWFACFSAMSSDFPPREGAPWHIRFLRWALSPLRRRLYVHDYLGSDPKNRPAPMADQGAQPGELMHQDSSCPSHP